MPPKTEFHDYKYLLLSLSFFSFSSSYNSLNHLRTGEAPSHYYKYLLLSLLPPSPSLPSTAHQVTEPAKELRRFFGVSVRQVVDVYDGRLDFDLRDSSTSPGESMIESTGRAIQFMHRISFVKSVIIDQYKELHALSH